MYKEAGEAAGRVGSMIIGAAVGGDTGKAMVKNQSIIDPKGKMTKDF